MKFIWNNNDQSDVRKVPNRAGDVYYFGQLHHWNCINPQMKTNVDQSFCFIKIQLLEWGSEDRGWLRDRKYNLNNVIF